MNGDTNGLSVIDAQPLAVVPDSGLALSLLPVPQMQAMLAEYDTRRKSFRHWLLSQLQQGVHYGVVPGTEAKQDANGNYVDWQNKIIYPDQWRPGKPSLYKAGADFLCDLMMLDPSFAPDVEAWKMLGSTAGLVVIHCRLLSRGDSPFFPNRSRGEVIGEGRGAGKAGEKKRDANAALKIAQKSAKVDAVINALGLSDLFTQDMEDRTADPLPKPDADPTQPKVGTRQERAAGAVNAVNAAAPQQVTKAMLGELFGHWKSKAPSPHTMPEFTAWSKEWLGVKADAVTLEYTSGWTIQLVEKCREVLHGL